MKTLKLYSAVLTMFILVRANAQEQLPAGVTPNWFSATTASIQKMEYSFRPAGKNQNFSVTNPGNYLGFAIEENGYTVKNIKRNTTEETWNAGFSLVGYGRGNSIIKPGNEFIPVTTSSSLTYQSKKLDIQYINDARGLRQNFIIKEKAAGEGKLVTGIQVQSSLTLSDLANNKFIFHTPGNNKDVKLIYDDLKVWDATEKVLPASMSLNASTNLITITVDDENAVYPVTIDPLNRSAEWTTSADGILPALLNNLQLQVQTTYGYTVAGLGDINGDGYDDVAVSAPTMADVITGAGNLTGVGAVFIYLGSSTGLPSIPNKILQPTTAVDGALFGFSIDAGDITGDGKNDIVIGAPLDSYQTSASGLFGATNVNVTAGKVYVYRSEDLFSAANPSPFLQIRLQGTSFFSTGILNILNSNVAVKSLFGYSVAVTQDLNGDNKADILIGAPSYIGVNLLSVQSGAAFVYYSNNLSTTSPAQFSAPDPTLLGIVDLPVANTGGLLFGFSLDGAGDYNNDGRPDVVIGAPAGVDLSSLGGVFTGQVVGGSAYIFYGNATGVNTTSSVKLQASGSGLLSNAANLFGYKVKGVENSFGAKNGNILIGAPNGSVLSNVVNGLKVKAGEVHVFKKKTPAASGTFEADQVLSSPRSSSILSILAGQTINVSLLFGSSFDNMTDINCDNIGDIIVGEPLSTAVPLLGADVAGGAAYIFTGKGDGTYNDTPIWDLKATVSPLLGVNTTSLIGFSVAGAGHVRGMGQGVRSIVGGPSNTLDFGIGLLNLGNTLGTTLDFAVDNNGLGKSYSFGYTSCNISLPVTLIDFKGYAKDKTVPLTWTSASELNFSHYELERSTDGINYQTISLAFAKNNLQNEYHYTDNHPYTGTNYYRLRMIDNDTKYTYSSIVTVKFAEKIGADIVIAPNPVQNFINLKMTGLEKGIYKMELLNTAGQLFVTRQVMVNQFAQTETIPRTGAMASGIYWINLYDNTNQRIKSVRIFIDK